MKARFSSRLIGAFVYLFVSGLLFLFASHAFAVPAAPFPFNVDQPDGTVISLQVKGDEHFNWMEDTDGYTVVRSSKGWYEYAEIGPSGHLNPNGLIVGRDNPRAAGLQQRILPSAAIRAQSAKTVSSSGSGSGSSAPQGVPPQGTIKNLVVMFRFSNHTGRTLPTKSDMEVLFNATSPHPTLAPTGSVRAVYLENSYGQMTLDSDVNPGMTGWITVANTEAYYANGQSGDSTLWLALRDALTQLDAVVDFRDYDADNNGRIDSIAFIHSGYGAEWGGTDAYGATQANRIWSHRWAIQPQWNSNDGVSVYDYHISPGVWGTSGSAIGRIGVIAHETGHFFGLPDLYDTDTTAGEGIGSWGLMANSWGFNGTQLCPPHFSPWSKVFLGWVNPTVISQPGQYTVNQSQSNPQVYRINSGFGSGEYLLIENRQNAGFDCAIPQGGLAIWHIDDNTGYNTQGYPGQVGWPANGSHYRVALLQADGLYDLERGNDRGDSTDMHHAAGVDAIGPGPGNHPNTDTYKGGVITQTGITISNISSSAPSMTFCLNGCNGIPSPTGLAATAQSTSNIALSWTDNSSTETGFTIERSSNGSTWSALTSVGANVSSYNNTGLSPNSTWHYRVQAYTATDTSAWSNTAVATTFDVPPAAPTGLNAVAASSSQINLNWVDQAGNETGYRLERSLNGTNGWSTVATKSANSISHSDSGLTANTQYFYRVAAFNTAGDSAFSDIANATTLPPPPYVDYVAQSQTASEGTVTGSYTNTQADDASVQTVAEIQVGGNPRTRRSSLSHRWTFQIVAGLSTSLSANAWSSASSDGDSFQFQWSSDGTNYTNAFVVSSTSSGNTQSAVLPGGLGGTVYVRVIDTNDTAGNSAIDTVSVDHLSIRVDNTPVAPPAAPTGLSATGISSSQINLSWSHSGTNEAGFRVERRPAGSGSYVEIASLGVNATSYSNLGLAAGTSYDYRVFAFNAGGEAASNVATGTTQAASAINLSASGFKSKGVINVDLSWSGAGGPVDVYRNGNKIANAVSGSTYRDNTGSKSSGTYTHQVCLAGGTTTCSNITSTVF